MLWALSLTKGRAARAAARLRLHATLRPAAAPGPHGSGDSAAPGLVQRGHQQPSHGLATLAAALTSRLSSCLVPRGPHLHPHHRALSVTAGAGAGSGSEPGAGAGREVEERSGSSAAGTQQAVAGERLSPDQPDSRRPDGARDTEGVRRELRAAARRGSAEEVLRVVERAGDCFDEAALVAALEAVGDVLGPPEGEGAQRGDAKEGARQQVAQHRTFQTLLSMVVAGAERLSPEQATAVARSLGRLRVDDQGVLDAIGRNVISELHRLSGRQLAELLEGYHATGASPGRVLADAVHERLAGALPRGGAGPAPTASGGAAGADALGSTAGGGGGDDATPAPPLGEAEAERVRAALERLGYGSAGHALPGRQGQSDGSHGTDYA
ncbi:hypothetical protein TSOC_000168 [Tetrabaena socialis]|uniref:Uncharacterized protein n=1 Tax=Tetrabaena socialis TaxID=47790 RepID=A0A2J8AK57_9CHLO|nr:hypothetical protein TSOC_000168 [Tetrabaena socialis]|eukprot:PNH12890.1 hypothetical protein TSOC_000168 [Tetrabaena socialis]